MKARIVAPITTVAAVGALAASLVIGLAPSVAASSAGSSSAAAAAARPAASALPAYYLALPGGDDFANVPGDAERVGVAKPGEARDRSI